MSDFRAPLDAGSGLTEIAGPITKAVLRPKGVLGTKFLGGPVEFFTRGRKPAAWENFVGPFTYIPYTIVPETIVSFLEM